MQEGFESLLGGSKGNLISWEWGISYKRLTLQASQASFFKDVSSIESKESMNELGKKIDSITQFCSKPYFNKALKNLAKENLENA